jgi:hypothetical protein
MAEVAESGGSEERTMIRARCDARPCEAAKYTTGYGSSFRDT